MITRMLTRLLTVKDDPRSGMDRRWRWWPVFMHWNGRVCVGLDFQMCRFRGVEETPRTVGGWHFSLVYDPVKWKVGADHGYYDGPHCAWQIGPFEFARDGIGWCLKCAPDSNDSLSTRNDEADDRCYNGNHTSTNGKCDVDGGRK